MQIRALAGNKYFRDSFHRIFYIFVEKNTLFYFLMTTVSYR